MKNYKKNYEVFVVIKKIINTVIIAIYNEFGYIYYNMSLLDHHRD
jgi:hypothetical protein